MFIGIFFRFLNINYIYNFILGDIFMIFVSKKRILSSLFVLFLAFSISIISSSKENVIETSGDLKTYRIIVDAGHGLPDGGAVSKDGILESNLNLEIARKLQEELESYGYDILMTRTTENNIADSDKQNSIREIKVSDLTNRVKIANESNSDFMISIHMNKYSESKYFGWQTFYSKNSERGKKLATLIQNSISNNIDRENKRTPLSIEGIKIVDKTNIPVVIVECGFLSNPDDLKLLQTEEYQNSIVKGICEGINDFYDM